MKRIFASMLLAVFLLTLAACRVNTAPKTTDTGNETTGVNETTGIENTTQSTTARWGVEDMLSTLSDQGLAEFYICLPDHVGVLQGTGAIGKQVDGSLIIVDSQDILLSPEVSGLSELFPAYFEQTESVLRGYYRMRGEDYRFEITAQSEVRINEYDMIKLTGKLSYLYERKPVNCNWVAYATQLKSNGAYVYWMVLDTDRNTACDSDIAWIAEQMAKTLRE